MKDDSAWLSPEDFVNIQFTTQWPKILIDLAEYLTGQKKILKNTVICEVEEF